jgi:threonine/homoserine/homoserine lactone efflux protein
MLEVQAVNPHQIMVLVAAVVQVLRELAEQAQLLEQVGLGHLLH